MSAIITSSYKRKLAGDLYKSYKDSDNFYIAIGRSQEWPGAADVPPDPLASAYEERKFRESMQSVIRATYAGYVIPKYKWSSGTYYPAYNDNVGDFPAEAEKQYYVYSEISNNVYLCIHQNKDANGNPQLSTVEPTGQSLREFKTPDGYVWKYMYTPSTSENSHLKSANFIICTKYDSVVGVEVQPHQVQQRLVQLNAIPGQIIGFARDSAGRNYTSVPSVVINGSGTGCAATAVLSGAGTIGYIKLNDSVSGNGLAMGRNYKNAKVTISGGGGTGAKFRPIFATNPDGLGADARIDLRSTSIMFNAKPDGFMNKDFIIDNKFRQMAILKKPMDSTGNVPFTGSTARALIKLNLSALCEFTLNSTITGGTSGAKAILDYKGLDSAYVYVHQIEETGYEAFQNGDVLTSSGGGTPVSVNSKVNPEIDIYKGTLYTVDNRLPVTRAAGSKEDLKPIVQF